MLCPKLRYFFMSFNSLFFFLYGKKRTNYSKFERPFSRAIFAFQYYIFKWWREWRSLTFGGTSRINTPDLKIQLECIKTKFVQGNGKNQNRASFTLSELTTRLLGGFKHPHENFGLFLLGTKLPFTTPPPQYLPSFVSNPLPSLLLYVNTMWRKLICSNPCVKFHTQPSWSYPS